MRRQQRTVTAGYARVRSEQAAREVVGQLRGLVHDPHVVSMSEPRERLAHRGAVEFACRQGAAVGEDGRHAVEEIEWRHGLAEIGRPANLKRHS